MDGSQSDEDQLLDIDEQVETDYYVGFQDQKLPQVESNPKKVSFDSCQPKIGILKSKND